MENSALTQDDKELLALLQKGDGVAFRLIYERYHSVLFRNIMRLLHHEEEARDILQEVFITLWEKRHTLDIGHPVNGWLFTVSYNKTINFLKKKLHTSLQMESIIQEMETPFEVESETGDIALLEEAISRLSPQRKKVFQLCKLQGKTYDKAATELGLSKYTVGEYLQEAMFFLRQYVREHRDIKSAILIIIIKLFYSQPP